MDARFDTSIRAFGISRGILVENPRNISVAEVPASLGSRHNRGRLCVLIEVLGGLPDPDQTIEQLVGIIHSTYSESTGSITGSIGTALRAANEWLFEENLNAPREQRGVAGASCVVLRDGELYLGQLGPALAYLLQPEGMRRFPMDSPWLLKAIPSESERAASPPMGVRRVVQPQFYHASVGVGDTFMLASPDVARLAAGQLIAQALRKGPEEAAQELQLFAHDRNVNVLIVTLEAEERLVLPGPEVVEPEGAGVAEEAEPVSVRARRRQRRPAALSLDPIVEVARVYSARGWRAIQGLLRAILPDGAPRRRATAGRAPGARARGASGRLVATLIVLIPILALAVVFVTRYQYDRSRASQVADLLRQASEARSSIMTTSQREAQRRALRQAIELIDQALEIAPDEVAALTLRQEVVEQLDTASVVYRLYTLWELTDLATTGTAPAELSEVIVSGPDVFVLDVAGDRVYHRVLTPAGDALEVPAVDALVVQKGEQRGAIAVGELVDMVWMPSGSERPSDNLLILERNGSLLEWDPLLGVSVLPVADAASWRKPQAAGAYYGNFYLLDPQQSRILKYLPTAAGYTDPPVDYLAESTQVDLSGAVDMAIDGSIYVLLADGSIVKLLGGEPQSFRVVDIDEPMRNPVAICVTGEGDAQGYVYVADAELARVVQLTKHGEFIRQFKAAEGQTQLDELRGLYVDEAGQRMYLASGSRLYMAPLSQSAPASAAPASSD